MSNKEKEEVFKSTLKHGFIMGKQYNTQNQMCYKNFADHQFEALIKLDNIYNIRQ